MTFEQEIAKRVEEEVEKRIKKWVGKAKGQNFPALIEKLEGELNRYGHALQQIKAKTGHFPLKAKETEELEVICDIALNGKREARMPLGMVNGTSVSRG